MQSQVNHRHKAQKAQQENNARQRVDHVNEGSRRERPCSRLDVV
jgi:hypothetical protein